MRKIRVIICDNGAKTPFHSCDSVVAGGRSSELVNSLASAALHVTLDYGRSRCQLNIRAAIRRTSAISSAASAPRDSRRIQFSPAATRCEAKWMAHQWVYLFSRLIVIGRSIHGRAVIFVTIAQTAMHSSQM